MDVLLELLEQYRCHLNRGDKSTADFLEDNFNEYLRDLKSAASRSEDNPLSGKEMCNMVLDQFHEIERNALGLIGVLRKYDEGKIVSASMDAFSLFDTMKSQLMIRYSGAFRREVYYRIRGIREDNSFPLERKELFHIPHSKNFLVGTERYSMPGHPCLYLASQAELGWYECGKPAKFAIAKFDIPQEKDNYLKFIDFSEKLLPLKHSFFCWFHNEKDDIEAVRKYLLKYLYTYPLRAACSVAVKHSGSKFIEEYVMPQLLLQWVVTDKDFDGIRYESCNADESVRALGGHNIVLVTKRFDEDGLDVKLRDCIKMGNPEIIDTTTITPDPRISDLLVGKDIKEEPFYWGMESISSEYGMV